MRRELKTRPAPGTPTRSTAHRNTAPLPAAQEDIEHKATVLPREVNPRSVMWNPFANMGTLAGNAVTIVRGQGAIVFDATGKRYLDALASLWYCNVGHGRAELADAAALQMRQLAAYQAFEAYSNLPAEALAQRLADLAPLPDTKVFFTAGGGSDAIDTAAKLARAFWRAVGRPKKQVTIARSRAYHGMNAYGTSLALIIRAPSRAGGDAVT